MKRSGESIVEVIVALGILAFMLVGAVSVVVSAVNLNLSARQRLVSISKTQKYLNEWLSVDRPDSSCKLTERPLGPGSVLPAPIAVGTGTPSDCNAAALTAQDQQCYWLGLSALANGEELPGLSLSESNNMFIKITSYSKWYTRALGEQKYEISQIIRKN